MIYIIPDIHGRTFWKDIAEKHGNEKIIFLMYIKYLGILNKAHNQLSKIILLALM